MNTQTQEPRNQQVPVRIRLGLLKIINDTHATKQERKQAEWIYDSVGCGACDFETAERYVIYRR